MTTETSFSGIGLIGPESTHAQLTRLARHAREIHSVIDGEMQSRVAGPDLVQNIRTAAQSMHVHKLIAQELVSRIDALAEPIAAETKAQAGTVTGGVAFFFGGTAELAGNLKEGFRRLQGSRQLTPQEVALLGRMVDALAPEGSGVPGTAAAIEAIHQELLRQENASLAALLIAGVLAVPDVTIQGNAGISANGKLAGAVGGVAGFEITSASDGPAGGLAAGLAAAIATSVMHALTT
jgi:hypothetical protein